MKLRIRTVQLELGYPIIYLKKFGDDSMSDNNLIISLNGSAGQSLGAFSKKRS